MRFHVAMEDWPQFANPELWYKTKLIARADGGSQCEEISYSSQLQACNEAFTKAKCLYLSGTHVGRHEGCKLADMQDVPDAQMRRLGRWDHSRMVKHYSSGLPRTGARSLAGFGHAEGMTMIHLCYMTIC